MVSLAATSRKYRGRKAETYDAVRTKQQRWKIENDAVDRMLESEKSCALIDVPVGTGRFFGTYKRLDILATGVDISEEMLALARAKIKRGKYDLIVNLCQGGILDLPELLHPKDGVVCVRFLDLIDEDAMRASMKCVCQMARQFVILTIRLGDKYVPKSNTAEHDRKKFLALVKRLGFRVEEEHPVFKAGWVVMKLRRVS